MPVIIFAAAALDHLLGVAMAVIIFGMQSTSILWGAGAGGRDRHQFRGWRGRRGGRSSSIRRTAGSASVIDSVEGRGEGGQVAINCAGRLSKGGRVQSSSILWGSRLGGHDRR